MRVIALQDFLLEVCSVVLVVVCLPVAALWGGCFVLAQVAVNMPGHQHANPLLECIIILIFPFMDLLSTG